MMARTRQRGVALVTAMLVVALAAIAAVAMTSRQQVDLRYTENHLSADQLRHYLHAAEAWAGEVLRDDAGDGAVDHAGEDWATRLPPIPVENGLISGYIEDAQARFNLNALVADDKVSGVELARFRRLLAAVGLDPGLADAVVDWIDADAERFSAQGAEDDYYMGRIPAYRTANRPMADVSELMLVAGFDAEACRQLAPFVVALPAHSAINLNTAPIEVIMSLADGISRSDAEQFVGDRPEDGHADLAAALAHPIFEQRELEAEGLDVGSRYFVLMSDVAYGRLQQRHRSLLLRGDGGVTGVLARARQQI